MKYGLFLNDKYQGFVRFSKKAMQPRIERIIGGKMSQVFDNLKTAKKYQSDKLKQWLSDYPLFVTLDSAKENDETIQNNLDLAEKANKLHAKIATGIDWTTDHRQTDFISKVKPAKKNKSTKEVVADKKQKPADTKAVEPSISVDNKEGSKDDFTTVFKCELTAEQLPTVVEHLKDDVLIGVKRRRYAFCPVSKEQYQGVIQLGLPKITQTMREKLGDFVSIEGDDIFSVTNDFINLFQLYRDSHSEQELVANFNIQAMFERYQRIKRGKINGSQAAVMVYTDANRHVERDCSIGSFVVCDNVNNKRYARGFIAGKKDNNQVECEAFASALEFLINTHLSERQIIVTLDNDLVLADLNKFINKGAHHLSATPYVNELLNKFKGNLKIRLVKSHGDVYGNILADGIKYFAEEMG